MVQEVLSEILQRVDSVAIIGDHVKLRQTGRTFKGLCPFHTEKTASFHVNPERGLWYCFGCGAGGNLFQFLMKISNLSFHEAAEVLAQKAGVALQADSDVQSKKRHRLSDVLNFAREYYQEVLMHTKLGEEGLKYLDARGILPKTIEKFQVGMAPASGQDLLKFLSQRNFQLEELRAVGLATKTNPPRDYFLKRILFPIWDSQGKVIAFGGRTMGEDQPKYLNSPENPLFKKSDVLYAFHLAKGALVKENFAILAEGYLDVLTLHQFHFETAVASLGTSLTTEHAKLLHRFVPKVIFGYDGDKAGLEAMRRALAIIEGTGIELAFLSFPPGEDPDSFLRKTGAESFKGLLQQALSPVDFVSAMAQRDYDASTPEGKKKIVDEILPILKAIQNPVLKDAYIKKVADSLDVSESAIRKQVKTSARAVPAKTEPSTSGEEEILRWILWEPSAAESVWTQLTPDYFESSAAQEGARVLYQRWQEKKTSFMDAGESSESAVAFLSSLSVTPPVGTVESLQALLKAQQNRHSRRELKLLKEDLSRRMKAGEVRSTDETYSKYLSLVRQVKHQGVNT